MYIQRPYMSLRAIFFMALFTYIQGGNLLLQSYLWIVLASVLAMYKILASLIILLTSSISLSRRILSLSTMSSSPRSWLYPEYNENWLILVPWSSCDWRLDLPNFLQSYESSIIHYPTLCSALSIIPHFDFQIIFFFLILLLLKGIFEDEQILLWCS